MLRLFITCVALTAAMQSSATPAGNRSLTPAQLAKMRDEISRSTGERVAIDRISQTPISGLYEVVSGNEVFYADSSGRYAIVDGRMMDLRSKTDLTQRRLDELQAVDFSALPLHLAIKKVQGSGRRVIAIFEDPTCPICKVLHKFIAQLPDLTIYSFPFPMASPEALPLTRSIWCSTDRAAAWENAMAGERLSSMATCDSSAVDHFLALGTQLKIVGTPTVILSNGKRIVGAMPPDQFVEAIDLLGAPSMER